MSVPVIDTIAGVRRQVADWRGAGRRVALVPTMGALHEGHLDLVRRAAEEADEVVVSVFVNPRQFDRPDDLAAYPRDLDGDLAALEALPRPPSAAFVPSAEEVYPRPPAVTVTVDGLDERLCGASRPGHFDGVVTVVTKLCNIVAPDVAVFGRKDFQQLQIVRRLVADLDLPVEIVGVRTRREADGLALSSRNRRLADDERAAARAIPRALAAAVAAARADRAAGRAHDPDVIREVAAGTMTQAPGCTIDYVEVVDPETLAPPDAPRGEAVEGDPARLLVAVAAHVGPVRLIDSVELGSTADEDALLAAVSD